MKSPLKPDLFILILDGPMGAGKTTVAGLLRGKLKRTAYLGLDRLKWDISDFKRIPADNEIVRDVIVAMAKEYLRHNINVILEQAMRADQIINFKKIAKQYGAKIFIYQFEAPKEVLLKRVHERPRISGKPRISNARIARNYKFYTEHKYKNGAPINVATLSAKRIASRIMKDLKYELN